MFNSRNIHGLAELSRKAAAQLNQELRIFDQLMEETVKNVPDDQKPQVEEVKAFSVKAINLAKKGRVEEAQALTKELIRQHQNGRKSNKEGL